MVFDFTQGTGRDKVGFEPGLTFPRAMLTSTVAAGGGSMAAGSRQPRGKTAGTVRIGAARSAFCTAQL